MISLKPKIRAFNAGQLSPTMLGRADHDKYAYGCRTLVNMLTRPQGPAYRRPGMEYIYPAKYDAKKSRLIPFVFSATQRYQLEFADGKLRFLTTDGIVLSTGTPYEITSPYPEADLFKIHHEQENDVMFMTCPGYEPRKLSRAGHTSWAVAEQRYDDGPFLDENATDTLKLAVASITKGSTGVALTATGGNVFEAGNVGGLFELSHVRPSAAYNGSYDSSVKTVTAIANASGKKKLTVNNSTNLTAGDNLAVTGTAGNDGQYVIQTVDDATHVTLTAAYTTAESGLTASAMTCSAAFEVFGKWEFVTHGNWHGTMQIQKSYDGGTSWQAYYTITSVMSGGVGDRNAAKSGDEEEKGILYRVAMIAWTEGVCNWDFTAEEKIVSGVVRVTAVTNATTAACTILSSPYATTATERWREGAWSIRRGWPATCLLAKGRLWFGGTTYQPTMVWSTVSGDYNKMADGVEADDAIIHRLNEARQDAVVWMADLDDLLLGTLGSEHSIVKINSNEPFTPTNIESPKQSKYGSEAVQAVVCNDVILFVAKGGKIIRELVYQYESEGYVANDLTVLAENITAGGVVEMAVQQSPYSMVYAVLGSGKLAVMNYERAQNVVGWSLISTDGLIESVSVIPGDVEDEVWCAVQRTIDGTVKRGIERFKPSAIASLEEAFFVDSGLTFDGGAAADITGIAVGASPFKVTVTAAGHGFANGNLVKITDVAGMTWLNTRIFQVADKTTDAFVLKTQDGTSYITGENWDAYTFGGQAQRVASTITGLSHLEGKTVQILGDGGLIAPQVVDSGAITLPVGKEANLVHIGLAYRSSLVPMPFEIPMQTGTSPSYKQRIFELIIQFYESLGCKIGPSESQLEGVNFMSINDDLNAATPLFTGIKAIPFAGGYTRSGEVWIVQDEPLPMMIISIEPKMGVEAN